MSHFIHFKLFRSANYGLYIHKQLIIIGLKDVKRENKQIGKKKNSKNKMLATCFDVVDIHFCLKDRQMEKNNQKTDTSMYRNDLRRSEGF